MRVLALLPALAFPAILGFSFASSTPGDVAVTDAAQPGVVEFGGADCAVIAAVAKEKYNFDSSHPAPPLKGVGDAGWRPHCNWSSFGLSFTDWNEYANDADPGERLKWVAFRKPVYDENGATIETSRMAGPMAGAGYSCRLRSGIAGWTVTACKTIWVS